MAKRPTSAAAESLSANEPSEGGFPGVTRPTPIPDGEWVDEAGHRWRLRGKGQQVPAKRVQHLLATPEVRVLLRAVSDWQLEDVPPATRAALWARMSPYLQRRFDRPPGDHTDFQVGEFVDGKGNRMAIVEEFC